MHPLLTVVTLGLGLNVAIVAALGSFTAACLVLAVCAATVLLFLDPSDSDAPDQLD